MYRYACTHKTLCTRDPANIETKRTVIVGRKEVCLEHRTHQRISVDLLRVFMEKRDNVTHLSGVFNRNHC